MTELGNICYFRVWDQSSPSFNSTDLQAEPLKYPEKSREPSRPACPLHATAVWGVCAGSIIESESAQPNASVQNQTPSVGDSLHSWAAGYAAEMAWQCISPALQPMRQRQEDHSELKTSLDYIVISRLLELVQVSKKKKNPRILPSIV